ncbi:MAG: DUF362 domain-containing protein [Phycisphaerae bacterium]
MSATRVHSVQTDACGGAKMGSCGPSSSRRHGARRHLRGVFAPRGFFRRWFFANSLVSGALALCWLVLRSGSKPSRFAYPCQQAALSAATLAFGAPIVAAVLAARRGIASALTRPMGVVVAALGLVATGGMWAYVSRADDYRGPQPGPPPDYRAKVYHVDGCPQDPAGDELLGLDNLLVVMGREGLKFYQSSVPSLLGGPDGIIATDDVVLIKINYQWTERGGTNTDLLRGLIRRIVDHPDTFTGEVIVCENAQFNSVNGFDRTNNNAQDHTLSPHDVVAGFQSLGYPVSHFDWTAIRFASVNEYSALDMANGYVLYDYDPVLHGRVSYPKFQTDQGTYVSTRYGIFNPGAGTYDRERLKFINLPVLKSHSGYGVTACVKHYMGTVTRELGTNSHSAIQYGILGALLGEIQPAHLNILDAIWINAIPDAGPYTSYSLATRRDELVASLDPVAADRWAAANILVPAFIANGYTPPFNRADPDNPASNFRVYLDNSMNYIRAAGYDVTNDPDLIDVFSGSGAAGDFDLDGDVDVDDFDQFASCHTGPAGGPVSQPCLPGDFDADDDIDCSDWAAFASVWTDAGAIPEFAPCNQSVPAVSLWGMAVAALLMLCAGTIVSTRAAAAHCSGIAGGGAEGSASRRK